MARILPCDLDGAEKLLVSKDDILGAFAMWAVRQSPYHRPDNLEVALDKLNDLLTPFWHQSQLGFVWFEGHELRDLIDTLVPGIPEVQAWNERKNGGSGIGWVDRFSSVHPDDDFISLDALCRNIYHQVHIDRHETQLANDRITERIKLQDENGEEEK